jgi:hypothetical protein
LPPGLTYGSPISNSRAKDLSMAEGVPEREKDGRLRSSIAKRCKIAQKLGNTPLDVARVRALAGLCNTAVDPPVTMAFSALV